MISLKILEKNCRRNRSRILAILFYLCKMKLKQAKKLSKSKGKIKERVAKLCRQKSCHLKTHWKLWIQSRRTSSVAFLDSFQS